MTEETDETNEMLQALAASDEELGAAITTLTDVLVRRAVASSARSEEYMLRFYRHMAQLYETRKTND